MFWLILAALVLMALLTRFWLRGSNHSHLDTPLPDCPPATPDEAQRRVLGRLAEFNRMERNLPFRQRVDAMRQMLDQLGDGKTFNAHFRPLVTCDAHGHSLDGEWVMADGADPDRRLLYVHGGAWMAGSAYSHRTITSRLSELTGMAVFAVNYRLFPEHRFHQGLTDCQQAYRWLLTNGPHGPAPLTSMVIAGDSAGGSHTLALLAWARDHRLRPADAAVALCPSTDLSFTSPSLRANLASDPMLGPAFGALTRVPRPLLYWGLWVLARVRAADPAVSPLQDSLANLPPTLIQASETEMLLDNARRYARKAERAGSPIELQTWPHMVHVWHFFTPELPQAEEAFRNIASFLARTVPASTGPKNNASTADTSRPSGAIL